MDVFLVPELTLETLLLSLPPFFSGHMRNLRASGEAGVGPRPPPRSGLTLTYLTGTEDCSQAQGATRPGGQLRCSAM